MAIREIRKTEDEVLRKVCKPVTQFDEKLGILLDDMYDTMIKNDGVGLAAPQVGVLRRLFVMDVGDGVIEAVNPQIVEKKGTQEDVEGCLSCPGEYGVTRRPQEVTLRAQDRYGREFTLTGSDLTARCICHENDHLDGILFKQHVIRMLDEDDM